MNAPLLAPLVLSGLLFALSAPAHAQQIKTVVTGIGITCPPNLSTPDLQAFSLALGYMYDIAKGVDTRPFKIGFFVGSDVVGADNGVKYKHNKKPWLAFQIGFDFTDN